MYSGDEQERSEDEGVVTQLEIKSLTLPPVDDVDGNTSPGRGAYRVTHRRDRPDRPTRTELLRYIEDSKKDTYLSYADSSDEEYAHIPPVDLSAKEQQQLQQQQQQRKQQAKQEDVIENSSSGSSIADLLQQGYAYGLDDDAPRRSSKPAAKAGATSQSGAGASAGKKRAFQGYFQTPRSDISVTGLPNRRHTKNAQDGDGDSNRLPPLYARNKPREVDFVPYDISSYRNLSKPAPLGGLGADLSNPERERKFQELQRQREYGRQVAAAHRVHIPRPVVPVSTLKKREPEVPYEVSKTKAAREYSKTIPKPRNQGTASPTQSLYHREVPAQTPMEAMELKHMIDLATVARIRAEYSSR